VGKLIHWQVIDVLHSYYTLMCGRSHLPIAFFAA
jgi:hypothetical protein